MSGKLVTKVSSNIYMWVIWQDSSNASAECYEIDFTVWSVTQVRIMEFIANIYLEQLRRHWNAKAKDDEEEA